MNRKDKRIFINCENTFGNFSFVRPKTEKQFDPIIQIGRMSSVSIQNESEDKDGIFMRLDFTSNLDGNIKDDDRAPLDIGSI